MENRIKNFYHENKFPIEIFFINKTLLIAISLIAAFSLPIGAGFKVNTENHFINLWAQWDGEAYLKIAEYGYIKLDDGRSLNNFLPLFPFLIRIFAVILGFGISAFIISNIASFVAVIFLYKIVKLDYEKISKKTTFFLLFFPTAFFFMAVYTESLFLAFVLISFYYARKGNWYVSGIAAFFIPLIRVVGILFFIPLFYEYLRQKKLKIDRDIFLVSISLLGVIAYFATMYFLTSNPLNYLDKESLWNYSRAISSPHEAIIYSANTFFNGNFVLKIYSMWNFFILGSFIFIFLYSIKKIRTSYLIYTLTVLIPPLFSSTLEAFSRFVIVAFPLFIATAMLSEDRRFRKVIPIVYTIFIIMLIVLTSRFVTGAVGGTIIEG